MPTLARVYGLSPSDVWQLTWTELQAFEDDFVKLTGGDDGGT